MSNKKPDPAPKAAPTSTQSAPAAAQTPVRKRLVLHKGDDSAAVVFPSSRDPGAIAFGNLKPDVEYVLSLDEARRLTAADRSHPFDFVTAEDAARAALPVATDTNTTQE